MKRRYSIQYLKRRRTLQKRNTIRKRFGEGGGSSDPLITLNGSLVRFTSSASKPFVSTEVNIVPQQSGSGDPSPSNVRPISGWTEVNVWDEATYDPTAQPKATISLGDTVYGGTLTINEDGSGELITTMAMVDMGTLNWAEDPNRASVFYASISDKQTGETIDPSVNYLLCEALWYRNSSVSTSYDNYISDYPSYAGTAVFGRCTLYSTKDEFKTAMSGVMLCYKINTPITISLTAQQINTLVGENNVWADSGDIEVTVYGTEIVEPDLNALQSLNILLGNRYVNTHEADEPTDEEALDIILGGNER